MHSRCLDRVEKLVQVVRPNSILQYTTSGPTSSLLPLSHATIPHHLLPSLPSRHIWRSTSTPHPAELTDYGHPIYNSCSRTITWDSCAANSSAHKESTRLRDETPIVESVGYAHSSPSILRHSRLLGHQAMNIHWQAFQRCFATTGSNSQQISRIFGTDHCM